MTPNTCNVENVTHINYHSDFRLIIRFNSDKLPDYPWRITFSTPSTHTVDKYVASFDGENYINCKPVDTLPGAAIVFSIIIGSGAGHWVTFSTWIFPITNFLTGKWILKSRVSRL